LVRALEMKKGNQVPLYEKLYEKGQSPTHIDGREGNDQTNMMAATKDTPKAETYPSIAGP
jgi:hypothetical protein